jgi:hypothetical protein
MATIVTEGNKYFFVSYQKEIEDTRKLIAQLIQSKWIDEDVILINCAPDYSSRLVQLINHGLSHLNNHELFETMPLEMPYPNMSQIYDPLEQKFKQFENYLFDWVRTYASTVDKYLFIDSGVLRGKNFSKLKQVVKAKIDINQYRFATLYRQDDSIFAPDFCVEEFNKENQGGLLFEWENFDNPNWDY